MNFKRLIPFALLCVLASISSHAQKAPLVQPHWTFVDQAGAPCVGCKLYSYLAGTTTATPTYTDSTGAHVNTNPIVLDVSGSALISVTPGLAIKLILKDALGATIWTADNIVLSSGGGGGCSVAGAPGQFIVTNGTGGCTIAPIQVNGTSLLSPSPVNFVDSATVQFTNSAAGNISATATAPLSTDFKHNGVDIGGQFATNPAIFDLDDLVPAPPSGDVSVTFQTDPATGKVSAYVPGVTAPSLTMSVTPPVGGQFVILYPSTNVFNGGALSLDNSDWGCEIVGASGLILSGSCSRTLSGPWVDVNGKTLAQLGIPTGNVTNIYGFTISNFNPGYFSDGSGVSSITGLSCTGLAPTALSNSGLQTEQVDALSGLVGSGINSATCDVHIQRNSSISTTSSNSNLNIYAIGLIVYYTGTPVPAPTALNIAYGLAYNPETNTLLTDPSYPVGQLAVKVADLPGPTSIPPSTYTVIDPANPFDCTIGGGASGIPPHSCNNKSGSWTTPASVTGLLQSPAGICPAGTNGQFTNVSCNFGGALTDAPTEIKSGNLPNTSPCTATDTFTAGNALVVVLQNNSAPPTDASDTFTLVWNASVAGSTTATYIATNIAGGSTTISATGLCRGTYTELTNVKVASPIDGTPVTHTQATTPVAYTIGPLTTTSPNDLIFTSELTCSGTPDIGLGFKQLGNGSIGPEGYVDSAIGSGIGEGVYQATWTSAPVCVGTGDSAYGIFAIKSAHSGGGGSGTPGGSNGNLQYNNAGAFGGDANTNDDGAGNLTAKSYATTGGSGQGGTVDMTEGTAASAAAGHDLLYADSTTHCVKLSTNGGSFSCIGTGGTVTSVAQTVPAWLAIAGSPVTTSGTLAITAATGQTSHQVIGTCNAATSFGPCALVAGDLPAVPLSGLATQAADTVVQNATGGTAVPTAVAMPTCTSGADLYNTSTHSWSCVSLSAGTVTVTGSPSSGNLSKFSGAASITNGDLSGDVTTSGTLATTIASNAVTTAKINNAAVTLAKIQNASTNSVLLGAGASGSGAAYSEIALGGGLSMAGTTLSATRAWSCGPGLGDGLNAIAAGTYLQTTCYNTTGSTVTLTGLSCFTDNGGTSTMNASGHTLGALLTGAVTCTTAFAAGTQSANVLLTSGDYIAFTFVADGTTKQTTWVVKGTY